MVIVLIFSGLIAGTVAGLGVWIAGYSIAFSALTYWATGTIALIFTALFHYLFSKIARWWWARNVDFRFHTIFCQSAAITGIGMITIGHALSGNDQGNMVLLGLALLLGAPIWLSIALDNLLGEPETKPLEDYL